MWHPDNLTPDGTVNFVILSYSNLPVRLPRSDWCRSCTWPTYDTSYLRIRSGNTLTHKSWISQSESSITGSCLVYCHGVMSGSWKDWNHIICGLLGISMHFHAFGMNWRMAEISTTTPQKSDATGGMFYNGCNLDYQISCRLRQALEICPKTDVKG